MTDTPDDSRPHSKSEMRRLDAQKPREWRYVGKFISQQGSQYAIIEGPEFGEHKVRLVERSEYDRVCAERDELLRWQEQTKHVGGNNVALLAENERLRGALEKIADRDAHGVMVTIAREALNHSHMGMFDDEGVIK